MSESKAETGIDDSRYRWIILVLMFIVQAGASMAIFSFGPLAPNLQDDLGITRAQVGMFSSAIYLGMVFFGTHAGWLTDKFGIRLFLIAGPGLMGLLFLCLSFINSFILLLIIVFISGIGYQFINPTTVKALSHWFPPRLRGTVIGIKQAGISFGGAVAALILPIAALSWGWQGGMIIIGVIILVTVFLCLIFFREKLTDEDVGKSTLITMKELRKVITDRNIVLLSIVGTMYCAPSVALSTFLVLYLNETLLVTIMIAGTCLMIFQFGTVAGRVFWGVISDRFFGGRRKGVMMIMGVFIAVMSVITIFITPGISYTVIYIFFALFGFSVGIHGVHVTFLAELAGKKMAATGVGFGAALSALGMVIATPVFGFLVDTTGSYKAAWLFLAILGVLGVVLLAFIHEDREELT